MKQLKFTQHLPFLLKMVMSCLFTYCLGYELQSSVTRSQTVVPVRSSGTGSKIQVLKFQESGVPSTESHAIYLATLPTLMSFTICYRLHSYFLRKELVVVSYALDDKNTNLIRLDHTQQGFRMLMDKALNVSNDKFPLRIWRHYCIAVDFSSASWYMAIQGRITSREERDARFINSSIPGGGLLLLGQDQDTLGGGFQQQQSLSGALTELHIWDRVLDEPVISAIGNFESNIQGNVLNWQKSSWELHGGVELEYVERDSFKISYVVYVMLAKRRIFSVSAQSCQSMQGKIATPTSDEETMQLYNYSKPFYSQCKNNIGYIYLWVGYTDDRTEGVWVDNSTGLPMAYPGSWGNYEPNGEREENCAAIHFDSALWNDITCSRAHLCSVCQFDHQVKIQVLGLCKQSVLDTEYLLAGEKFGIPYFSGTTGSSILWSPSHSAWIMESILDKKAFGVMQTNDEGEGTLPLGSKYWKFNTVICPGLGNAMMLTVSSCGPGSFTCGDGLCIPLAQRCDRRTHCSDHSDEEQCNILGLSKGYRGEIPPKNPSDPSAVLPLYLWVDILALTSINTVTMEFTVDFLLKLAWHDHRLSYYNLKNETDLNSLAREERNLIWIPTLSFKTARGNRHTVFDDEARIHILKMGEPQTPSMTMLHEVEVYSGNESPLLLERKYRVQYRCTFDLNLYPFDTQRCIMEFEVLFVTACHISLQPGKVTFFGRRQLVEYVVGDIIMDASKTNSSFSGLQVEMLFTRQSGYHLVATYLPTSLMIIIAYLTFYFQVEDFNDRIMVSLTSLLVLSSLLTQTSETLPKTSYFKMVDVWLFFCIVTIFMVILIHTASICAEQKFEEQETVKYSQYTRGKTDKHTELQRERREYSRVVNKRHQVKYYQRTAVTKFSLTPTFILSFGKIGVAFAIVIFNIVYWLLVFIQYKLYVVI